jgi:hypothetical protein
MTYPTFKDGERKRFAVRILVSAVQNPEAVFSPEVEIPMRYLQQE